MGQHERGARESARPLTFPFNHGFPAEPARSGPTRQRCPGSSAEVEKQLHPRGRGSSMASSPSASRSPSEDPGHLPPGVSLKGTLTRRPRGRGPSPTTRRRCTTPRSPPQMELCEQERIQMRATCCPWRWRGSAVAIRSPRHSHHQQQTPGFIHSSSPLSNRF